MDLTSESGFLCINIFVIYKIIKELAFKTQEKFKQLTKLKVEDIKSLDSEKYIPDSEKYIPVIKKLKIKNVTQ